MDAKDLKIQEYFKDGELQVESLFNDFSKYIYTIVKRTSSQLSDEDVEEIISDTIIAIWKNREKLDINKKMAPYVAGVCINLIKKKYRDLKILENIEDFEQQITASEDIEINQIQNEYYKEIMNKLDSMKEEDKEIFILYYFNGYGIKKIAITKEMSESKVKSKLFRVRKKLRKYIKREEV